jgi:hypothetical protein
MKRLGIALALGLALAPTAGFAQTIGYVEGSVGTALIAQVSTSTYSFTDSSGNVYSGNGVLNYGPSITAGAEAGIAGLDSGNIRLGISYDFIRTSLHSAGISGTFNGTPVGTITVTNALIRSAGFDFDTTVHAISANAYYNLPLIGEVIRPYVGLGAGAAILEHADTNLTITGTLGFRYAISDAAYIGMKYKFFYIDGPTEDFGVRFDPVFANTISAVIGFYT